MLSLYLSQPRPSWLHRIAAGYKLLALAVASVLLLPITQAWPLALALGLGMLGHLSLGFAGRRRLLALLKGLLPMLFFLALAQWFALIISLGWPAGIAPGLEQALLNAASNFVAGGAGRPGHAFKHHPRTAARLTVFS